MASRITKKDSPYSHVAGRYDEAYAADTLARKQWGPFERYLKSLSSSQLKQIVADGIRAIEADGVTYTVYTDTDGADRPWALDPLPLILPAEEWAYIERGIAQRAQLLNAVLADIYGPQRLIAEGYLPPALVFGHHGFLWPCHGIRPPGGIFLHNYAADIARSPDGRWWVLADRTQAPSGAGYALQNRYIVARNFNQPFRDLHVQHLAGFFATAQASLKAMCPSEGETPFIVLLTPGPYNETYFEHAFLARQLGFPLVEGQDLSVRGNKVFLKTLGGLRRVHGILRRLDDDFCDPVELRADSALGIPGLLAAVRAGNVLVSNSLGTGVLENAALLGFLPAICEKLLGESLILPSVATWWCGEAPALAYAMTHLDQLIVKPAFPSMHSHAVFGHRLDAEGVEEVVARVCANPHAWVAQEWMKPSQVPTLDDNMQLTPRTMGLRAFACIAQDGYAVMSGGLARIAGKHDRDVISMQRGGSSKDTWVLTDGPLARHRLVKARLSAPDVLRKSSHTPSRVVENLFWMGRYAERCEASTRLLRASFSRLSEYTDSDASEMAALIQLCQWKGLLPLPEADTESAYFDPISNKLELALLDSIHSLDNPNSIQATIQRLHWCSAHLRERLSADNWHALNRMSEALSQPKRHLGDALRTLDWLMLWLASLSGFAMDDMTRDEGWRFLIIGRCIERLNALSGILSSYLRMNEPLRDAALEAMLKIFDSIVTYRVRYQRLPELLPALYLIVFDLDNPHAISFQIDALQRYLQRLHHETGKNVGGILAPIGNALASFDLARLENLSLLSTEHEQNMSTEALAGLLDKAGLSALELSDEITQLFFALAEPVRQTGLGLEVAA